MRLIILILLGIFLFNFANVMGESETVTNFNIGGCIFDFEDGTVGVAVGECSTSPLGRFYCDDDKYGWITTDVGLGCSMGQTSYVRGSGSCCPSDYSCDEIESGEFQCVRRTESCNIHEDSGECAAADCIWLDLVGACVSGVEDISCGYYNTETLCNNDEFNLGQIGVGTELAGGYIECDGEIYSIPVENYKCKWYEGDTLDKQCRITYSAVQAGWGGTGTQNIFSCSNVYELGECIEGSQSVTWFSNSTVESGFIGDIPEECLEAFNCNGGEDERFCGEPVIKMPGFSLFAFFASLSIIGMYYLRK